MVGCLEWPFLVSARVNTQQLTLSLNLRPRPLELLLFSKLSVCIIFSRILSSLTNMPAVPSSASGTHDSS